MLSQDIRQDLASIVALTHDWSADFSSFKFQPQDKLMTWLLDQGSTTSKFKRLAVQSHVEVLEQHHDLGLPASAYRAVMIKVIDEPIILARSWLYSPKDSSCYKDFIALGEQPLGKLLFAERVLWQRSVFEYCCLEKAIATKRGNDTTLWGRRSDFIKEPSHRLHLVEYFLPNIGNLPHETVEAR